MSSEQAICKTKVMEEHKQIKLKKNKESNKDTNIKNKGTGSGAGGSNTNKNGLKPKMSVENYKEGLEWAINPPNTVTKILNIDECIEETKKDYEKDGLEWVFNPQNRKQCKDLLKEKEKKWGNKMIGQTNNCQWTTKLGEYLVHDTLLKLGENPRNVENIDGNIDGFKPDWETDHAIYEVKTSSYHVNGTAGEKTLATPIKYQDIPKIYNKPLYIVCVAYQEYELTYGKTNYFGDNIKPGTKEFLELAKKWNIKYIPFSELIKKIDINQL